MTSNINIGGRAYVAETLLTGTSAWNTIVIADDVLYFRGNDNTVYKLPMSPRPAAASRVAGKSSTPQSLPRVPRCVWDTSVSLTPKRTSP